MPVPSENACNYIYDNWKNTTHLELVLRTTPILYARRFQPDEYIFLPLTRCTQVLVSGCCLLRDL